MPSDLWTRVVSGVLFPLHERAKRHSTVAMRHAHEQSQWWPRERLEAYRLERLRRLLVRAEQSSTFYRERFRAAGFAPRELGALADLARLPLLTKSDIRENAETLRARDAGPLIRTNTGGSSGEPLVFFLGSERVSADVAAKWRATRWWDVDIGDREMVIWGSPIELGAQDRVRAVRDRLFRSELVSAFKLDAPTMESILDRVSAFRPRMLFGYPSAISRIARHAEERGRDMRAAGVAVTFVTAERLYDEQRADIARVFGCRVANGYGGRDAGFLAHECPSGTMHVTAEDVILETVDAQGRPVGEGEAGEIVVTHLASGDFPFIRYRTGDVGVLGEGACACSRTLPHLKEVHGRTTDFVVAADGSVMHGLALIYVVREQTGVAAFKIIQESLETTRVQIVPASGYSASIAANIAEGMRRRLGAGVQVLIEEVAAIAPERNGKFRYVVSHVAAGSL